jgi:hypothetical protein
VRGLGFHEIVMHDIIKLPTLTSLIRQFVGDKINSEDTWILILEHLGVTSRTFVTAQ